MHAAQIAVVHR